MERTAPRIPPSLPTHRNAAYAVPVTTLQPQLSPAEVLEPLVDGETMVYRLFDVGYAIQIPNPPVTIAKSRSSAKPTTC